MIIYQCDQCSKQGPDLKLQLVGDYKEYCLDCIDSLEIKRIRTANLSQVNSLPGCVKCKMTGILQQYKTAEYMRGHYDDQSFLLFQETPIVYCGCAKGTALNPSTRFEIK